MGLKSRLIKVQNIAEIHGDEEFLNSWETYTLTKSIHEVHIFFFSSTFHEILKFPHTHTFI